MCFFSLYNFRFWNFICLFLKFNSSLWYFICISLKSSFLFWNFMCFFWNLITLFGISCVLFEILITFFKILIAFFRILIVLFWPPTWPRYIIHQTPKKEIWSPINVPNTRLPIPLVPVSPASRFQQAQHLGSPPLPLAIRPFSPTFYHQETRQTLRKS